jgi:hypothetical protein
MTRLQHPTDFFLAEHAWMDLQSSDLMGTSLLPRYIYFVRCLGKGNHQEICSHNCSFLSSACIWAYNFISGVWFLQVDFRVWKDFAKDGACMDSSAIQGNCLTIERPGLYKWIVNSENLGCHGAYTFLIIDKRYFIKVYIALNSNPDDWCN